MSPSQSLLAEAIQLIVLGQRNGQFGARGGQTTSRLFAPSATCFWRLRANCNSKLCYLLRSALMVACLGLAHARLQQWRQKQG